MTWNCWSGWASSVKWKRPDWEQLKAAALDPKQRFSILPRGNVWQVRSREGLVMSEHRDAESARKQCQRMGWRYL
jgi:hypothetical protein